MENIFTFKGVDFGRAQPDGKRDDSVIQMLQPGRADDGRCYF
ncbi:hypothetical protein FHX12_005374 [Rhizobium sp. BK609]|nr:hypothetical protein [Rhizobium sp. BK098]MBB3618354.1 hypothetical protein [Rhizobium sp. BK609]MBB3684011.1 hypothetical protein [Rhizobium sp. BK612]